MTAREPGWDYGVGPRSIQRSMRLTDSADRETWLCRSTVGAGSDVDDDLWSETSDDAAEQQPADDMGGGAAHCESSSSQADGVGFKHSATKDGALKANSARPRKLTLGSHLDGVRSHALHKVMPPIALTPLGADAAESTPQAKKRRHRMAPTAGIMPTKDADDGDKKQKKHAADGDAHLTICMDYEREEGFGKTPRRQELYAVRHVWHVHVALFMSTACVHCVSFNVSPALRRLFRIEALPVGLCIVVAWTILGLVNCLGACIGSRGDRIVLLRRLSWLWVVAIVILQVTKVLPLPRVLANSLLGIGYVFAVLAHGLLVPNAIAAGAEVVSTQALMTLAHDVDSGLRQQQTVDVAIGAYFTAGFGAMMLAASSVQVYYFALVNLELSAREDLLILRGQRAVLVTIPCAALLLALVVVFLFQSQHHRVPSSTHLEACMPTPTQTQHPTQAATRNSSQSMNALERKLARNEFECCGSPSSAADCAKGGRVGVCEWLRLIRRSVALVALTFFLLVILVAIGAALVAHAAVDQSSSSSTLVHLVIFAVLVIGWLMTMLLSASQLAPSSRDKLYGGIDGLSTLERLPSRRQLFVLVALVCLASAAALAAFVRAQLYSTLFVQTCQLRRPLEAALVFDPNVMGAWVGFASVLLLPPAHFLLRGKTKPTSTRDASSPRVSAVRRVVLGVLLYLVSIFLASVVELYRRDSRRSSREPMLSAHVAGCTKSQPSNFAAVWSVPHLLVLSLADAVFRVSAAEEAYALAAPLEWVNVAQGVLSLADSVGYASALAMSTTLSSWLYQVQPSDLVLLLLIITAITSLSYALTKRLADHVHASRQPRRALQDEDDASEDQANTPRALDAFAADWAGDGDCAGRKEAHLVAQDVAALTRCQGGAAVLLKRDAR